MPKGFSVSLTRKSKMMIRRLRKAGAERELFDAIIRLWDKESQLIAGHISRTKLSGQRKGVRSGTLRRSIVGQAMRFRGVPAMRVGVLRGPALAYAGLQEFGTKKYNRQSPYETVRPKNSKYLAFPPQGSPAVLPSGVPRYSGPREFPGTLVFVPFAGKNAAGGLYSASDLAGAESLREIQVVYLLLRKMDVRPGFFLRDGMTERLPGLIEKTVAVIEEFYARRITGV